MTLIALRIAELSPELRAEINTSKKVKVRKQPEPEKIERLKNQGFNFKEEHTGGDGGHIDVVIGHCGE